jgi:hypothetical protein
MVMRRDEGHSPRSSRVALIDCNSHRKPEVSRSLFFWLVEACARGSQILIWDRRAGGSRWQDPPDKSIGSSFVGVSVLSVVSVVGPDASCSQAPGKAMGYHRSLWTPSR